MSKRFISITALAVIAALGLSACADGGMWGHDHDRGDRDHHHDGGDHFAPGQHDTPTQAPR